MVELAQVFRADLDDVTVKAYRRALSGISPSILGATFNRATSHSNSARRGYMPVPAEILEAAEIVKEQLPRVPAAECNLCGGSGWKPVTREVVVAEPHGKPPVKEPRSFAVRCDHRAGIPKTSTRTAPQVAQSARALEVLSSIPETSVLGAGD